MNTIGMMSSKGCPICGGQWCRPLFHSIEDRMDVYKQVVTINDAINALDAITKHDYSDVNWDKVKCILNDCKNLNIISCDEAMEILLTCKSERKVR